MNNSNGVLQWNRDNRDSILDIYIHSIYNIYIYIYIILLDYNQASKIQINGTETPPLCNKVVPQRV